MLNVHLVAASLASAQPAAVPPPELAPALEAPPAEHSAPEIVELSATEPSQAIGDPVSGPNATAPDAAPENTDDIALDPLPEDNDPLEPINRVSFDVSQAFDKVLIRPVAIAYRHVIPHPLRDGVRNAINNAREPMVAVNDLLQLKPKRALHTVGRFLINTILGIGGLFDIAKRRDFNLPHHGNSLGNTLGFYGVKPGPYIYLPLLGPATLRDQVDRLEGRPFPHEFNDPLDAAGAGLAPLVLGGLDQRERNDDELKALLDDAVDPYATFRSTWLQNRQAEIDALKAPDGLPPGEAHSGDPLPGLAGEPVPSPHAEPEVDTSPETLPAP